MKRLTALLGVAALVLGTSAVNADTFTVPVNQTWTSTTTISIDFDLPSDATAVNSISIDISHTFQSDLTFSATSSAGFYDLLTPSGGGQDLGVTGSGTAGDESTYTFVPAGGIPAGSTFSLGGGTIDANSFPTGPADAAGWNVTLIDDFAGDGGSVASITVDFDTRAIPEPASALALLGLGTFVAVRRRR